MFSCDKLFLFSHLFSPLALSCLSLSLVPQQSPRMGSSQVIHQAAAASAVAMLRALILFTHQFFQQLQQLQHCHHSVSYFKREAAEHRKSFSCTHWEFFLLLLEKVLWYCSMIVPRLFHEGKNYVACMRFFSLLILSPPFKLADKERNLCRGDNQMLCRDGTCIDLIRVCDGIRDCDDDEYNCPPPGR